MILRDKIISAMRDVDDCGPELSAAYAGAATNVIFTELHEPTPELVEAVCQARLYSDHPDMRWDDVVTEGAAVIERMIAERQLAAIAAHLKGQI